MSGPLFLLLILLSDFFLGWIIYNTYQKESSSFKKWLIIGGALVLLLCDNSIFVPDSIVNPDLALYTIIPNFLVTIIFALYLFVVNRKMVLLLLPQILLASMWAFVVYAISTFGVNLG